MNAYDKERRARILELLDSQGTDGENADAVLNFLKQEVRDACIRGLQADRGQKQSGRKGFEGSK
jgi:hypothetical protein